MSAARTEEGAMGEAGRMQIVEFVLGGEWYGVPLEAVAEVVSLKRVTDGSGASLEEALPIETLELRTLLGSPTGSGGGDVALVLQTGGRRRSLVVDGVRGVRSVDPASIHSPPAYYGGATARLVSGLAESEQKLVVLLKPEALAPAGDET